MPYDPQRTRAYPAGCAPIRWNAADGWPVRMLRCDAVGAAKGSILLMGGRGDFIEKYIETARDLQESGWNICAMDWRGQGDSGRLSPNPRIGHADDFGVWVDDLAHFWQRFTSEMPGPHMLIAHSMGGHLALRALSEARVAPRAAVLLAPMMGYRGGIPMALGQRIASLMCRIGDPQRGAWKVSEKPGSPVFDRMRLLTHDAQRYSDEAYWQEQIPALPMGPASWGWVRAGYISMRKLLRAQTLAPVQTPILMLVAMDDALVNPAMAIKAAGFLPHAQLATYGEEAAHELIREIDPIRDDVMHRIMTFLDTKAVNP